MRILIAVHGYPPTHHGGAERRAARTARELAARGHQICVLCVESVSTGRGTLRWEDSQEDNILVRRLFLDMDPGDDPFRWGYDNPQAAESVARLIEWWHPELMHLFSGYLLSSSAVRVAKQYQLPVVVSLTDYWWLCERITLVRSDGTRCDGPSTVGCARCHAEQYRRFRLPAQFWPGGATSLWGMAERHKVLGDRLGLPREIARATTLLSVLSQVDALIAPSQYLADTYVRQGISPQRIHVRRQGVELDRCPVRVGRTALRVGYIGQMKHHKGAHLLLDAWPRLRGPRPRHLVLYGSDSGEEDYGRWLHALLQHLEHASWDGAFRGSEVWQILADLDVLVVPSRWVENSPNSILEAQAVGVPIVGANLGGIAELVQHERNGLLFETDSSSDLARQLQRLLDEPDLLSRLRQHPLPFRTIDDEVDDIVAIYETVAGTRGTPREEEIGSRGLQPTDSMVAIGL